MQRLHSPLSLAPPMGLPLAPAGLAKPAATHQPEPTAQTLCFLRSPQLVAVAVATERALAVAAAVVVETRQTQPQGVPARQTKATQAAPIAAVDLLAVVARALRGKDQAAAPLLVAVAVVSPQVLLDHQ